MSSSQHAASIEVVPAEADRRDDMAAVLQRFSAGGDCVHHEHGSVGVRLEGGDTAMAGVVRALDAEGIAVASLQLHAPTLDDVFLDKTGRSLEGSGDGEDKGDGAYIADSERAVEGTPA